MTPNWARLGAWVALTYVGFAMCGGNHLQTSGPTVPFDPPDVDASAAAVGFVFGAVGGAIIASLQWIVLRSLAPRARGWIPFTALGFGLAHAFNDVVPYRPLDLPVIVLADGLVIAVLQSIALLHELPQWFWVPVAAVAWVLGFTVGIALLGQIETSPLAELLIGHGAIGLVIGVITGAALAWRIGSQRVSKSAMTS